MDSSLQRFSAVTEVFLASNNPSHFDSFSMEHDRRVILKDGDVSIAVEGTQRTFDPRAPQRSGFRLEFRDFGSTDEAFAYAHSYVLTLASRAASTANTALSINLSRHDDIPNEDLKRVFDKAQRAIFQIMPGINIHPTLPYLTSYTKLEGLLQTSLAAPAGKWVDKLMDGQTRVRDDKLLKLALAAFTTACEQSEPELRLLNIFAALECLAGHGSAPEETISGVSSIKEKIARAPEFSDEEKKLLERAFKPLTSGGRRDALEKLAFQAGAPEELRRLIAPAYSARGASIRRSRRVRSNLWRRL